MNTATILTCMTFRQREFNRKDPAFVESVNKELNEQDLEWRTHKLQSFFLMAATKGIYIDADRGTTETICYLTTNVLYKHVSKMPVTNIFREDKDFIADEGGLGYLADNSLFILGFMPLLPLQEGVPTELVANTGAQCYNMLSDMAGTKDEQSLFKGLAIDFDGYVEAVRHTVDTYFSR